jgi:hypothetical protein
MPAFDRFEMAWLIQQTKEPLNRGHDKRAKYAEHQPLSRPPRQNRRNDTDADLGRERRSPPKEGT